MAQKKNLFNIVKKRFLKSETKRGEGLKKNILGLLALRGVDVGISYLRFPLTLRFLGTELHGVWLTVGGIINWFGFFNIGLGTGLRNKLAEAFAQKDTKLARSYVSSTYAIISMISFLMLILLIIGALTLNWPKIVAISDSYEGMLVSTLLIVFSFFAIRFVLKLIGIILVADQRPALSQMLQSISSVLFFIGIWIALKYRIMFGSLVVVGVLSSGSVLMVQAIASIILFSGRYKKIRPSIRYVDWHKFRSLASVGIQFFIVQISVIVMFSTDNIIISQITGPSDVVPYNVARKFFGITEMLFMIVLEPFWSAFTQAFVKKEFRWIRKSINQLLVLWGISVLGSLIMLALSGWVYRIWIGELVKVPFHLSVLMMLFFTIKTWNNIFVYLINGVGKIRLQLYMSIIIALINIPVSVFFAKHMGMGSGGVILGTILCLAFGAVLHPIQYKKIINGTARGIWNQ
ncbi:MATE family efflux transporter [Thermophagus sp. OGC60D27]|uniref:MATE family efflux transporter n=1 Tax=Thermophagus sp. OGC60D27 TaxID=3458415 RepID=UPI0040383146